MRTLPSAVPGRVALGASLLALAVSAFVALRDDLPEPGECVDEVARAALHGLRTELQRARGQDPHVCVDEGARAELAALGSRSADSATAGSGIQEGDPGEADAPGHATSPASRVYVRFDVPHPAVTVTARDDGTYDVRTTDPSLAGSVIEVTAFTDSGSPERVSVRIPGGDGAIGVAPTAP